MRSSNIHSPSSVFDSCIWLCLVSISHSHSENDLSRILSQDAALIACVCVIRSMKSVGSRCVHATAVQGCTGEVFWDKTVEASRQQPGCLGSASRLKSRPWPWPRIPPSRPHRGRTSLLIGEQEKSIHSWSKPKAFGWKPHLASIQEETLPREKKDANFNLKLQNEVAENKLDGAWSLHSFLLSSPPTQSQMAQFQCVQEILWSYDDQRTDTGRC